MKSTNQKKTYFQTDRCELTLKKGNGILTASTLQDDEGNIIEYSFAYVNHRICTKDNGRVIGYDNAHGVHHCHRMGKYEIVNFESFDKISEIFENEWREYHAKQ